MLRLGLDIGSTSIGWFLYRITNGMIAEIIDCGVRLFSDGRDAKTGVSSAVERRNARALRRRRDRYLRRRAALMRRLAAAGLMPEDPSQAKPLELLDPYRLRADALDRRLELTELGRALFHLNQRRGFKSNRQTDRGNNEGGKIIDGSARLDQAMMAVGARTYGEFLHLRRSQAEDLRRVPSVRTRLTLRSVDGGKAETGYDFYPDRRHLEEEFNKVWAAQAAHHPVLTDSLRHEVFETIFFQRPLKAPAVGRCLFFPEPRLPRAHPLTQRRVLYETVNALRIRTESGAAVPLGKEQRDKVIMLLDGKAPVKAIASAKLSLKAIAKHLKLRDGQTFTLEKGRDYIACDPVRASLSHPDRFGPRWSVLEAEVQAEIVGRIRDDDDTMALVEWLKQVHGLDDAHARATADAPLPEGYVRLGETATRKLLDCLKAEVLTYSEAVGKALDQHHSDRRTGEILESLPYYGEVLQAHVIPGTGEPHHDDITRFGRITNPTVHIGLNQLRRLVNRIIARYGKPAEIVVELARDLKQSTGQKKAAIALNLKNRKAAEARSALLTEWGVPDTGANRMYVRLWQELHEDPMMRRCPYTGTIISPSLLFSGAIDIDHILPYSRTLDDSTANRTLCMKEANRQKRNKSPSEARRDGMRIWALEDDNLRHIPEFKRWRFAEDAMARFEGERDFEARALVDTQYLSRISKAYLETLYDGADGKSHVWVVPGRLTEMLRRHWGLNGILTDPLRDVTKEKNRMDHRHHAIDAAVVAATDRGLIKAMAEQARTDVDQGREALASSIMPPWPGFREAVAAQVDRIIVSHRPDHGRIDLTTRMKGRDQTTGPLHRDTAYGLTGQSEKGVPLVVTREPFDNLTPTMIGKIRDEPLKAALAAVTAGKKDDAFAEALAHFRDRPGPYHGIRRVRLIEPISVVEIRDASGRAYKGYKGNSNHCFEVWRLPGGAITEHIVSTFDAHQPGPEPRPHPAAKRLLRLFKSDMVKLDDSKFGPVIATVVMFDRNGKISLVPHTASNARKRCEKYKEDLYLRFTARTLIEAGARRIIVDETGHFRDPGRKG
ncbi:type II CRISPR RNA-guided endonuclease Cas9 [Haematospirillum jordaniae]|uniref:type II CRISPR RNA-guided endonuclease Cas9 n=1 Tax=Haematospirillum jordaniae TaxID=1549855 RepID=UPI0014332515|nr:type II CRISPR RNA-guided endonuclease Cas9 [Haematospirillum jordaniae]NKD84334.1 type II CRISPR RNA-guided endonuclease Cas9 [Haematospirillum jordaniae]